MRRATKTLTFPFTTLAPATDDTNILRTPIDLYEAWNKPEKPKMACQSDTARILVFDFELSIGDRV